MSANQAKPDRAGACTKDAREPNNPTILTLLLGVVFCTIYGGRIALTSLSLQLVTERELSNAWKATILASFYWGYAPPQIISAWLASHAGSKLMLFLVLLSTAISFMAVSLLVAFADATTDPGEEHVASLSDLQLGIITAVIVLCGFGQSVFVPVVSIIWSQIPDRQFVRRLQASMSWCSSVSRFAFTAVTPPFAAYLGVSKGFATISLLTLLATVCWGVWMPTLKRGGNEKKDGSVVTLCSLRFWKLIGQCPSISIFLGHFCGNWLSIAVDVVCLGSLRQRFGLDIVTATSYLSSPKLLGFVMPFVTLYVDQTVLRRKLGMTNLHVRRVCCAIAKLGGALSMVIMFLATSENQFFVGLVVFFFTRAFQSSGYNANYIEVGGKSNSGVLTAVGNSFANLSGLAVPPVMVLCGSMLGNREFTYLVSAGISVACGAHFFLYSSVEEAFLDTKKEK